MENPKALIKYSDKKQDVYKDIEEYNAGRECNVLLVFSDMIDDIISKKKLNPILAGLFYGR